MARAAFCFKNNESRVRREIRVEFKILPLPDKALAVLADRSTVRVCLLQKRLKELVGNLSLGDNLLCWGDIPNGGVDIQRMTIDGLPTKSHLTVWVCHEVCLDNLAINGLRKFTVYLNNKFALILDRKWELKNLRDFFKNAVELLFEVTIIVNYAKVRMMCPSIKHFLIEHTSNAKSLFVRLLIALCVGGSGVVFLCSIGSGDEMQDSIVAGGDGGGGATNFLKELLPHLW